jgi:hypothetical protein
MSNANFNMSMPETAVAVTLSDTVPNKFSALFVSAGTVKITDRQGNITSWAFPAGGYLWMPTSLVWLTGTTAGMTVIGLA